MTEQQMVEKMKKLQTVEKMKKLQTTEDFKDAYIKYLKIILFIFGAGLLFISELELLTFRLLAPIVTAVTGFSIFFWKVFDNYLWKLKFFKNLLSPDYEVPNIKGEWSGILIRGNINNKTNPFYIDIKQQYSKIEIVGISGASSADSLTADFFYKGISDRNEYQLRYSWNGSYKDEQETKKQKKKKQKKKKQKKKKQEKDLSNFIGYTIFDLRSDEETGEEYLIGQYFTNKKEDYSYGKICVVRKPILKD